jgi:hypothetical protein
MRPGPELRSSYGVAAAISSASALVASEWVRDEMARARLRAFMERPSLV